MLIISPGIICKLTSFTAARPPNVFVTLRSSSRGPPDDASSGARFSTSRVLITNLLFSSLLLLFSPSRPYPGRNCSFNAHLCFKSGICNGNIQGSQHIGFLFRQVLVQFAFPARAGDQALRAENHDHNQDHTEDQVTDIAEGKTWDNLSNRVVNGKQGGTGFSSQSVELAQNQDIKRVDSQRADNHAGNAAQSTNNDHCQVNDGVAIAKDIGRNNPELGPM